MIILYDSKCDFCLWFVGLVDRKIKKGVHVEKYDLRTTEARQFLKQKNVSFINLNTIYVVDEQVYIKSKAVLRIMRKMRLPYATLYAFSLLPRALTDAAYDFVARNRYKISRLFRRGHGQKLPA